MEKEKVREEKLNAKKRELALQLEVSLYIHKLHIRTGKRSAVSVFHFQCETAKLAWRSRFVPGIGLFYTVLGLFFVLDLSVEQQFRVLQAPVR